ncbi:MAG TPA: T9SS type A sorting domain-containing protein [Saprospiraceae bacterium]|nr:T9SS type A sorting domain-containing protein [Saprospiraceae bacterium]
MVFGFGYGQNSNPINGSPFNYGKVSRVLPGIFFDKSANNTWNLSFVKPDYLVELKYQPVINERYKGKSIAADIMLVYPDGQRLYFSKKGTSIVCTSAIVSSEITKSGFMFVEFDGGKPYHFTERLSNTKYSARVRLEKNELIPSFANILPFAEAIILKVDYAISKINVETGILEINNIKPRAQRFSASIQALGNVQIETKGQIRDFSLRISSWPSYFRSDLTWANYEFINFYVDAFIEPVISYKIKENNIRELRTQLSPSEATLFAQDEKGVVAYPNPSSGVVFLDLINYPKGQYRVEIYNLVGFKVKTIHLDENENSGLKLDLSDLRPSMYSYTVFDSNGKRLANKRINLISS